MKIGIDIVNMVRVQNWYKKDKLMKKVFSANELKIIEEISGRRRIEFIAGRFAVKEAVIKAISAKHKLSLIEIETITLETGAPRLCLHGKTKDRCV